MSSFVNAGLLYFYSDHINEFFSSVFSPKNAVHTVVLNAMKIGSLKVTLRALGIIGKTITGPYQKVTSAATNILDLNDKYLDLQTNFSQWANDASPLLSPCSIFSDVPVPEDPVYHSLLSPNSDDNKVKQLLSVLCKACLRVVERQLSSQLPGGEFWEPNPALEQAAKSCHSSNISGERNFAMADLHMHHAKNAKLGFIESRVMFKQNKTEAWLCGKGEQEKSQMIALAVKAGREVHREEKQDKENVLKQVRDQLRESRLAMLEKEDKDRVRLENYLEDLFQFGGLWEADKITTNLAKIDGKTKKIKALKAQINVWVKILKVSVNDPVSITKADVPELYK